MRKSQPMHCLHLPEVNYSVKKISLTFDLKKKNKHTCNCNIIYKLQGLTEIKKINLIQILLKRQYNLLRCFGYNRTKCNYDFLFCIVQETHSKGQSHPV